MTLRTLTDVSFLAGTGRTRTRYGEPVAYAEGLYRIAPDVYAWMVPNGSWGETNVGLVDCGGASVLIDTCWDLRYTREMLDACADLTRVSPIEAVINTHADGDHCWGNQLFADRPIIATNACIAHMRHLRPETLRAVRGSSALLSLIPLGGIDGLGRYVGRMFEPYDFRGIRITDPNEGFSHQRTLTIRGVELVVTEVGPAHTDGDAIVHVPSKRTVFAGDLLFVGVTPVMWSGPMERMMSGLGLVLGLDVDVIVPGHGPLARKADVQALIDYWDHVQNALYPRCRAGLTPAEAAHDVLHGADFRARPWARWDSPERLLTSAHTLYRHWGNAAPTLPGPLGQLDRMREQARIAETLVEATPRMMHRRR